MLLLVQNMTAMLVVIIMPLIVARWRNAPKQNVLDFYRFVEYKVWVRIEIRTRRGNTVSNNFEP